MAVILEIPVPYRAHVAKRGRVTIVTFVATLPVRVPEIAPGRAPVALRAVLPDGRPVAYREIGGQLARPLAVEFAGREIPVTAGNADEALRSFRESLRYGNTYWPFLPEHEKTYAWPLPDGAEARHIVSSDREDRIRAYREAFETGAAFVDGMLFVPSLGPAWVVLGERHAHAELRPEFGHERDYRHPKDRVFAWDRLAEAEAKARELSEGDRLPGPHPAGSHRPGPTRGHVVSRADLEAGVGELHLEVAAAAEAMLAMAAPGLHCMPPAAIHAFADLRAILDAGLDADAAEGAMMALRDLHERWLEFRGAGPEPGADPVADLLARVARERSAASNLDEVDLGILGATI